MNDSWFLKAGSPALATLLILAALLPIAAPERVAAQSLGEPFEVLPPHLGPQKDPRILRHPIGGYSLAWLWDASAGLPLPQPGVGGLVLLEESGAQLSVISLIAAKPGGPAIDGILVDLDLEVDDEGDLLVGLADQGPGPLRNQRPLFQRFSRIPTPRGPLQRVFDDPDLAINEQDLALAGDGTLITAVDVVGVLSPSFFRRILGQIRGPGNGVLRPGFALDEMPVFTDHLDPALDAGSDGGFVLAYEDDVPEGFGGRLIARRFDANGDPQGPEIVASPLDRAAQEMLVKMAPDGRFAVAWAEEIDQLGPTVAVGYRVFDAQDQPVTDAFELVPIIGPSHEENFLRNLSMTMDSRGGTLVLWQRQDFSGTEALEGRFVNHRGVPQGEIVIFVEGDEVSSPGRAALGDDGRGILVWSRGSDSRIFAVPFAAPRDDELCVHRGPELHCDTANDSGAFEETLRFGLGPEAGDRALLGDIDGDGEDDYCLRRNALFLCDADGRGAPSEFKQRFGLRSHGALLGDMDGDGDDDPCLRIGRRLACDLAHDGPPSEYRQVFGGFGEELLLGDINGDGRDEACLYRLGRFLCDPQQQGSPATFSSAFLGAPGDTPFLGDVDGDGRDDFCVLNGEGQLVCDVAQDGSPPVVFAQGKSFNLETGDRLLLGNIDGF